MRTWIVRHRSTVMERKGLNSPNVHTDETQGQLSVMCYSKVNALGLIKRNTRSLNQILRRQICLSISEKLLHNTIVVSPRNRQLTIITIAAA